MYLSMSFFMMTGGRLLQRGDGVFEALKKLGHLSHFKSLGTTSAGQLGQGLDARVRGTIFTEEYYASNHMMGG
jgi:hypothetical protein